MESDNPYKGKHGMHYNQIRSFYSFQIYICGNDMYIHVMMLVYNFHDSQGVLFSYLVLQIAVDMLDLLSYQCNRKFSCFPRRSLKCDCVNFFGFGSEFVSM